MKYSIRISARFELKVLVNISLRCIINVFQNYTKECVPSRSQFVLLNFLILNPYRVSLNILLISSMMFRAIISNDYLGYQNCSLPWFPNLSKGQANLRMITPVDRIAQSSDGGLSNWKVARTNLSQDPLPKACPVAPVSRVVNSVSLSLFLSSFPWIRGAWKAEFDLQIGHVAVSQSYRV